MFLRTNTLRNYYAIGRTAYFDVITSNNAHFNGREWQRAILYNLDSPLAKEFLMVRTK